MEQMVPGRVVCVCGVDNGSTQSGFGGKSVHEDVVGSF